MGSWRRDDQGAGSAAGVAAIEELTARGVDVNVTLLFSVQRYEEVGPRRPPARLRAARAERRAPSRDRVGGVVLRLAGSIRRPRHCSLKGRRCGAGSRSPTPIVRTVATSRDSAARAGQRSPPTSLARSARCGPAPATKNPAYSDVLYVERLIAPDGQHDAPPDTGCVRRARQGRAGARHRPLRARAGSARRRPTPASTSRR
jgi:hypothetical protein